MEKYSDFDTFEMAEKFAKYLSDVMSDDMFDTDTAIPLTSKEAHNLIGELVEFLDPGIRLVIG